METQNAVRKYVDRALIDMEELNDWQRAAIVLLATKREHKMGYEAIAAEIGVSAVTLYRFRQRKDVQDYILRFNMQRIVDRLPEMLDKMMDNAIQNGSVKSAELILKYAGLLVERRSIDADIKAQAVDVSDKSNDDLQTELEELRRKLEETA